MAIQYSGATCELREVVLKDKPASMLQASPKGTVPVLLDCGKVIDESIDIMAWALSKSDPDSWLDHALDHEVIERNDGEFKSALDRYKYFDRYPEQPQSWYFEQALLFLNDLEVMLVKAQASNDNYFLASSKMTALDVAVFPFVRQFAFVNKPHFDALNLPRLQSWLAFFLRSETFTGVMTKYTAWKPGQEEVILFGM